MNSVPEQGVGEGQATVYPACPNCDSPQPNCSASVAPKSRYLGRRQNDFAADFRRFSFDSEKSSFEKYFIYLFYIRTSGFAPSF